ncbi:hypothetical protein [Collimonas silvisoli]|uniref:hypothetical protein n=1 Tax=Collimonas silvisoli TaxID=2825884 RepID=UPI001B8BABFF|nr:hypothetical protein [Collimonas silvisoli]
MTTCAIEHTPDPIGSVASGVSVKWDHNGEPGAVDRALFVFTEAATGNQTRYEVSPRVHTCLPLAAGLYQVAVFAKGLEQYRGSLELMPGEPTSFTPILTPAKGTKKTLEDVLSRLEVDAVESPRDLIVPKNTRVVLDSRDQQYAHDWKNLSIKNVESAKRILGHPDNFFSSKFSRFPPPSLSMRSQPQDLAAATAREYVYGNSATVSQWQDQINSALFKEIWMFPVFILGTVTINAGGVLEIGNQANFFVCQLLRMHITGTLLIRGTGPNHIEPLALETFC